MKKLRFIAVLLLLLTGAGYVIGLACSPVAAFYAGLGIQITGGDIVSISTVPTSYINVKSDVSPAAKGDGQIAYNGAMDNNSTAVLTDTVDAPFVTGDAGKLICVTGTSATTQGGVHESICGTISSYSDASHVTLSFKNASGGAITSAQFKWATDDCASGAIPNAITAVSASGGTVYFPLGNYGCAQSLAYLGEYGVSLVGSGSVTLTNWHYDTTANLQSNTTGIWWLTTGLSNPALTMGNAAGNGSGMIYGISFEGGVGNDWHGGGNDGIDFLNQHIDMENVNISNFAGNGIQFAQNNSDGVAEARNLRVQYSGSSALKFNSNNAQNFLCNTCELEDSGAYGVLIAQWTANNAGNLNFLNTIIQNNDQFNSAAELGTSGLILNGEVAFIGCWFDSTKNSSFIKSTDLASFAGVSFLNSHQLPRTLGEVFIPFSAAGTAVPTCTEYLAHHLPICVTDAKTGTNGTVYGVGETGGSIHVLVQCDGTNWNETGTGCY